MLLTACGSTSRLESAPEVKVDLTGRWLLDRRESDDVRARLLPLFERRESRLRNQERRYEDGPPLPTQPEAGGARPADVSAVQWIWQQRRREIEVLIAFASPANRLDIAHSQTSRQEVRIANDKGEGARVLTPGESSTLFTGMGGFAVSSGWREASFVIQSRGVNANPIRVLERYTLIDSGATLELRLDVRLPEVGAHKFRFLYRRADS
jgi:hypothetical protein